MIDAEVVLEVTATCDQCKGSVSNTDFPDPWTTYNIEDEIEEALQAFIRQGWEIEDEDVLCPDCIKAREDETEPLDPNRENGGISPLYGIGLKLFDE